MTPPKLSDTGEKLKAIAAEAMEDVLVRRDGEERRDGYDRRNTPLAHSESSERLQQMLDGRDAQHQIKCVTSGPIAEVWRAIEKMRDATAAREKEGLEREAKTMAQIADERGYARGVLQAQARQATRIQAVIGIVTVAVAALGLYLRIRP